MHIWICIIVVIFFFFLLEYQFSGFFFSCRLAVQNSEVPLLLRDCIALLLQIVLTLPLNIDKGILLIIFILFLIWFLFMYFKIIKLTYILNDCMKKIANFVARSSFHWERWIFKMNQLFFFERNVFSKNFFMP